MKLIVCLDDRDGILFFGRRLSSDRVVISEIAEIVGSAPLRIHPYSRELFSDQSFNLHVDDGFLKQAGKNDWFFLEQGEIPIDPAEVEILYVFRWNRHYPSDVKFDLSPFQGRLTKTDFYELTGYSHPVIGVEVYTKCGQRSRN